MPRRLSRLGNGSVMAMKMMSSIKDIKQEVEHDEIFIEIFDISPQHYDIAGDSIKKKCKENANATYHRKYSRRGWAALTLVIMRALHSRSAIAPIRGHMVCCRNFNYCDNFFVKFSLFRQLYSKFHHIIEIFVCINKP
jgi:hypothetical protein